MKNRMALIGLLALAGCASTPEYTWVKPKATEQQYTIADAACTAEAYKAIPDGGKVSCAPVGSHVLCNSGVGKKARAVREKIYDGCMIGKGWEKQPAQ